MKVEDLTSEDYASIFGIGFHHVLKMDEGLVVEYQGELYAIVKHQDEGQTTIYINEISDDDITDFDDTDKLESGRWIWMHDRLQEN